MNRVGAPILVLVILCGACGKPPDAAQPDIPVPPPIIGTVTGTIRLSGTITPGPPIKPGMGDESLVFGPGQTLANVYVAVKSGLGERKFSPPSQPVLLNQVDLAYSPHVVALMTNQPLVIRNGDKVMHNEHFLPKRNPPFTGHFPTGTDPIYPFKFAEVGIRVACDVHPWMRAWVHVSDHPFFAVTERDGKYAISGLPPGDYEMMAWHERFQNAPLVAKVKVAANQTSTLDFTFEFKPK